MPNPETRKVKILYFFLDESGDIEWPPKGHTKFCLTLLVLEQTEFGVVRVSDEKGSQVTKRRTPKHKFERLIRSTAVGFRRHLAGRHYAELTQIHPVVNNSSSGKKLITEWIRENVLELKGWNHNTPLFGLNYHLDDIGNQFFHKAIKIDNSYIATILFDKGRAYTNGERIFCNTRRECKEYLKWKHANKLFEYDEAMINKLTTCSKLFSMSKSAKKEIALHFKSSGPKKREKIDRLLEKEAKLVAHHGMVRTYALILKFLLIRLRPHLPSADQVVFVADEKFQQKIDKKQLDQVIINTIKDKINEPHPQVRFRNSKNNECLQAVDLFCNFLYGFGNSGLTLSPHDAILNERKRIEEALGEPWLNIFEMILKNKIVTWISTSSWSEIQKAK